MYGANMYYKENNFAEFILMNNRCCNTLFMIKLISHSVLGTFNTRFKP